MKGKLSIFKFVHVTARPMNFPTQLAASIQRL